MKNQILPKMNLSLRWNPVASLASIGIILLVVGTTGCTEKKVTSGKESSLEAITERIRPVGKVNVVSATEGTTGAEDSSSAAVETKPQEKPTAQPQRAGGTDQATATAKSSQGDQLARGKTVVEKSCAPCHSGNLPGAPVIGNSADWASRLSQGEETLIQHVINGYNAMPPRGGNPGLSNEDIAAAVNYIISQVKQ